MITAIRATSRYARRLSSRHEFESDPDLGSSFSGAGTMRVYLNTPAEMTGHPQRSLGVALPGDPRRGHAQPATRAGQPHPHPAGARCRCGCTT